jgi:hypothetical protein
MAGLWPNKAIGIRYTWKVKVLSYIIQYTQSSVFQQVLTERAFKHSSFGLPINLT